MDCDRYTELISAALDGELTAEERRALDSHLSVCPECARLFRTLSDHAKAMRELDCEVPADLKERIMANLPAQQGVKHGRILRWKRWIPVAAAACLALVVALTPGHDAMNESGANAPMAVRSPQESCAPQTQSDDFGAAVDSAPAAAPETPGSVSAGCEYGSESEHYMLENRQTIAVSYGSTPAPGATIIGSTDALEAYLSQFGAVEYSEEDDPLPIAELDELRAACDEEFFRTRRLLCVVVEASSGSIRYELDPQGLSDTAVTVRMHVPEAGTCDMAAWLLTAEVDTMWEDDCVLDVSFVR